MREHITRRLGFEVHAFPQLESLYRTALLVLNDESSARDLVQRSFARAYYSWLKHRIDPNCRVWLFRIMTNGLAERFRCSMNQSDIMCGADEVDDYAAHSDLPNRSPEDDCGPFPVSELSSDDVKWTIGNLPDGCRLITILSLVEGFSYQEIADITGLRIETVRSRLWQGRRIARECLSTLLPTTTAVG